MDRFFLQLKGLRREEVSPFLAHFLTCQEGFVIQIEEYFLQYVWDVFLQQSIKASHHKQNLLVLPATKNDLFFNISDNTKQLDNKRRRDCGQPANQ